MKVSIHDYYEGRTSIHIAAPEFGSITLYAPPDDFELEDHREGATTSAASEEAPAPEEVAHAAVGADGGWHGVDFEKERLADAEVSVAVPLRVVVGLLDHYGDSKICFGSRACRHDVLEQLGWWKELQALPAVQSEG